jgi:transketolase
MQYRTRPPRGADRCPTIDETAMNFPANATPPANAPDLVGRARWLRRQILDMVVPTGKGHIPSSYSMAEILVCLYYGGVARVTPKNPSDPDRDRVIVSKGHAAIAQYPILADLGFFPKDELSRYTQPGGILGMYADNRIPGIEGISGSLGHGLGMGAGMALAARMDKRRYNAFVVLGDGECYEGSVWEAAMFAAHHRLDNLVAVVDRNRQCILGQTERLLAFGDLEGKWRGFGWEAVTVDGHSVDELQTAFARRGLVEGRPLCIVAETVKGKGLSFMEGQEHWHSQMPNPEQLALARSELAERP